jgi:hypothetical protein
MDKSNAPLDVDGDHTQPDKGEIPKTPEEMSKKTSKKMSEQMSKTTTKTFQTGISAGKTKNQLARNPRLLSTPLLLPRLPSPR